MWEVLSNVRLRVFFLNKKGLCLNIFICLGNNPVDCELFDKFTVRSNSISDSYVRYKPIAVHCRYCCGLH